MILTEFAIGRAFWTAAGQWRCTNIGTRVVVAISLGPVRLTQSDHGVTTDVTIPADEADEAGYFRGPPYGVAEHVFDEDAMQGCAPTREAHAAESGEAQV